MFKKGWYRFIAYSMTHNQVLYRLTEYRVENHVNYDLLFSGGTHINLPFWIEIEGIYLDQSTGILDLIKRIIVKHKAGEGFYEGHRVCYQENDLPPAKSSIPSDLEPTLTEENIKNMIERIKEIGYEKYCELYLKSDWKILI